MKSIFYICGIGISLLLTSACSEKKEKNILIDLDQSFKTKEIKLSELTDNIKCIPLETTEEFVLPDNSVRYWVSDKYIITLSNKDIRQFSPEGKYIRKLASAGKGPDEYNSIISYTVDEINDVLYYGHTGDWQNITAINLQNGQHMGKIRTRSLPGAMQTVEGNILYLPLNYNNLSKCDILFLSPEGKVLDSLPSPADSNANILGSTSHSPVPSIEEAIFLHHNDTLFHFDFKQPVPIIAVRYLNKFSPETNLNGVSWQLLFKNKNYVIAQKQLINMQRNENSVRASMRNDDHLFIDLHTLTPQKIEKFYIDPLQKEYDNFPPFHLTGKKLSYPVSAFSIKELVRTREEDGESVPPLLRQLDEQLTEESNPVLIVGNLK